MKVGRNDPCPCGSGRKYKQCCLGKTATLAVRPANQPQTIDYHLSHDGHEWRRRPGALSLTVVTVDPADFDADIQHLFSPSLAAAKAAGSTQLVEKLRNCKHKLYAARYHLRAICDEIDRRVADYQASHEGASGADFEHMNTVLIYETEAFLFQVKSNLDLMVQALACTVPPMKSFHTFAHSGEKDSYRSGGKVIAALAKAGRVDLAALIESNRTGWIQEMTRMRDTVAHHSELKGFRSFVERRYEGGETAKIQYPIMPSGVRVDAYCHATYDKLFDLYKGVLAMSTDLGTGGPAEHERPEVTEP